jgi:hypothetical protein
MVWKRPVPLLEPGKEEFFSICRSYQGGGGGGRGRISGQGLQGIAIRLVQERGSYVMPSALNSP